MPRNREIEVKLAVGDLPAVVKRLEGLGARRVARVFEQNALFDTPDEHFRRHESILRIRVEENVDPEGRPQGPERRKSACEGLLTFKCPTEGARKVRRIAGSRYKEREEIEYRLPDAGRFARLLERLGLRVWFRYEKYRTHYRISGSTLKIDLDETPMGTFLELEGSRRSIDRAAEALGYSVRDYNSASYFELYAIECGRRGIPVANMAFSSKKNANSRTLRLTKFASAFNK